MTGKPKGRVKTFIAGLVLFACLVLLLVAGVIPRLQRNKTLAAGAKEVETEEALVNVVRVESSGNSSEIKLPASMQAIQEAPIYARTDGYLRRRLVDIGDRIKTGTVMAEIEAPEVDQQLAQARANAAHAVASLTQARANLKQSQSKLLIAKITSERWKQLVATGVVSKQEGDERQSTFEAAAAEVDAEEANIHAAESDVSAQNANVKRLQEMRGFQRVVAPFDGVVTARNVDAGALISSGSASSQRELFRMAKTDQLRIFVNVPQSVSTSIRAGETAVIMVGEFPGRTFPGKIIRTANALDPNSRTLLTEIHIPNGNNVLMPGMFASVAFTVNRKQAPMLIPAGVIAFQTQGPRVALVGPGDRIHYVDVKVGRDYGSTIEVIGGLTPGARAVLNPTDDLAEGQKVQIAKK